MKLTKRQSKNHDDAMALINLSRKLTDEEVEFVFQNFHPGASHNVTSAGAFFTPMTLARDLASMAYPIGNVGTYRCVDACAGIGMLAWAMVKADTIEKKFREIVAIEYNPDYVEIGKRLVPEANWIVGDVFHQKLWKDLRTFDIGISNPPYGNISFGIENRYWIPLDNPAHLAIAGILARACMNSYLIIPFKDHFIPAGDSFKSYRSSGFYADFCTAYPGVSIIPEPIDCSQYKFRDTNIEVSVVSLEFEGERNDYFGKI